MGIFPPENRIKCGNCGTEFDFNRNTNGCPLCNFGDKKTVKEELKTASVEKVNYLAIKESLRELRSELLTEERDFRKEAIAAYDSAILFNRRIIEFNRHLEEVLSAYVFMIKMFSAKMEIENFTANAIEILAFSEKALDLIRSNIELIETMPKIRALYSRLLYLQGNALYSLGMKEEALENYLLAKSLQAEDKSAENAGTGNRQARGK